MRRTVGKWVYIVIFCCCVLATAFLVWKESIPCKNISVSTNLNTELFSEDDDPVYVDINTADAETLQLLPGIGPVIAERIVSFRQENGMFRSAEQLKQVSGIGEKIYEKIKGLIVAGGKK